MRERYEINVNSAKGNRAEGWESGSRTGGAGVAGAVEAVIGGG
jgi:hypothetical protein